MKVIEAEYNFLESKSTNEEVEYAKGWSPDTIMWSLLTGNSLLNVPSDGT